MQETDKLNDSCRSRLEERFLLAYSSPSFLGSSSSRNGASRYSKRATFRSVFRNAEVLP